LFQGFESCVFVVRRAHSFRQCPPSAQTQTD
jgi:hypothetical protein